MSFIMSNLDEFISGYGAQYPLSTAEYGLPSALNHMPLVAAGQPAAQHVYVYNSAMLIRVGYNLSTLPYTIKPSKLYIYGGSFPTQLEVDALTNTSIASFKPAQLLVSGESLPATSTDYRSFSATFGSTNMAVGTGTATWFLWHIPNTSNVNYPLFFVGTVGPELSNADVKMANLEIQQGILYQLPALNIPMTPTTFEF